MKEACQVLSLDHGSSIQGAIQRETHVFKRVSNINAKKITLVSTKEIKIYNDERGAWNAHRFVT